MTTYIIKPSLIKDLEDYYNSIRFEYEKTPDVQGKFFEEYLIGCEFKPASVCCEFEGMLIGRVTTNHPMPYEALVRLPKSSLEKIK